MTTKSYRSLSKTASALTNVLQGYSPYANRQKFRLINRTLSSILPDARSFADLGGVWKVDAAYTQYTLRNFSIDRALLVDTDFPPNLVRRLSRWKQLQTICADFASESARASIGSVDVVYFFDVLLHQANPHWDEVLRKYSQVCRCMIVYNQQWIQSSKSLRLTDLPVEEYLRTVPGGRQEVYREYYARRDEIHPKFQKRYIDIHNMWQWGITDNDLRSTMNELGFREIYFENFGRFGDLSSFENHAFVFIKK